VDFVWTEKLAVGVREIDIQHRVLFSKIDDLIKAMETDNSDNNDDAHEEHIAKFFEFLEDYAASHFKMEQKAMGVYKYPDKAEHIVQHDIFKKAIGELRDSYISNGATAELKAQLKVSLCDWLVDHVSIVDKALGEFLKSRAKSL
jgi:hemerythrin